MVIEVFIAKAIRSTIRSYRTIKFGITFNVKGVFVAIPVDLAIGVNGAMPIIMAGNVWPRPRSTRADLNQATLDCEAGKDD